MKVKLVAAQDRHFAWMLGQSMPPLHLKMAPGGVDAPETLAMLRDLRKTLRRSACRASWLIVAADEVVGLCGFLTAPDSKGLVKFGYGIAQSRRRMGYGSVAVGLIVDKALRNPTICTLAADTAAGNIISQRVLQKNGFVNCGTLFDPEDGLLIQWRRPVRRWHLPHPQVLTDLIGRLKQAKPRGHRLLREQI